MAQFNADVVIRALTGEAEKAIDRLDKKLQGLGKGAGRDVAEAFVPKGQLKKLDAELKKINERFDSSVKRFARTVEGGGFLAVASKGAADTSQALDGLVQQLKDFDSAVQGASAWQKTFLPGFEQISGEIHKTTQAFTGFQNVVDNFAGFGKGLLDVLSQLPVELGAGAGAVALLGSVINGQLIKELSSLEANATEALRGFTDSSQTALREMLRLGDATQGTANQYRRLIRIGEERLNNVRADSNEARRAANTVVRGQQLLNAELEKQNDLLREAAGLRPQSVENRATNTYRTTQRRADFERQVATEYEAVSKSLEELARAQAAVENERLNVRAEQLQIRLEKQIRAENDESILALRRRAEIEETISRNRSARLVRERAEFLRGDPNQYAFPAFPADTPNRGAQNAAARADQEIQAAKQNLELRYNWLKVLKDGADISADLVRLSNQDNQALRDKLELKKREEAFERKIGAIKDREDKKQARRRQAESIALGAGFPLLFGGGAGSVAGGVVGSLFDADGGFAGQILVGALGQKLDEIAAVAGTFAASLREGGDAVAFLEENIGRIDPKIKNYIKNLQQSGQTARAAAAATEELARVVGTDAAEAFRLAGDRANDYGDRLKQLGLQFIALGYQSNEFFKNATGGGGVEDRLLQRFGFGEAAPKPDPAITQAAQDRVTALARQVDLQELLTESEKVSKKTNEDQYYIYQEQIAQKEYLIENEKIYTDFVRGRITQEERALQVLQNQLVLKGKLNSIEIAREESAIAAAAKADKAARKQTDITKSLLSLQRELVSETLKAADIDVRSTELSQGKAAAVAEEISQLQARLDLEARSLDLEKQSKLLADQLTAQETQLIQGVYKEKLANLTASYNLRLQELRVVQAQLEAEKQIAEYDRARATEDIGRDITGQIARIQGELANPFGGEALERYNLQLDQAERRLNTITPLIREVQDVQTQIDNIAAAGGYTGELEKQKKGLEDQIALYEELLPQLDAYEQAQLRQNQLLEKYGFLVDGISTGLADAVTAAVTGSETVEEAFSRMFQNIGRAFIEMATQMLAQQAVLSLLKALSGGGLGLGSIGSGGGFGGWSGGSFGVDTTGMGMGFTPFAEGGFVTGPTTARIGEGGSDEYVIPSSKMGSAMARWNQGMRGDAVVSGANAAGEGGMAGGAEPAPQITINGGITQVGGENYIRQDQLPSILAQAGKLGESRALRRLQMSGSTRRKVGI